MTAVGSEDLLTERIGAGERAFVVGVLLLSLGVFANLTITGPIRTQNMGMLGMQILWSILYLIMLGFYFRNCPNPFRTLFGLKPFLILLGFVFVSVFWSQDPALTVRRATALVLTFVFGAYFASRFSFREQFRLLGWTFSICIIFSFVFELLGLNPSQEIPGWYGVFYHKTELGRNFVLACLIYLIWGRIDPKYKRAATLGLIASMSLVLLSRDVTSLVTLPVLLITFPYLRRAASWGVMRGVITTIVILTAGCTIALFIFEHLDSVTTLVGKDPMLTGRVPVWILATLMALRRPWFGYGFDAFWLPDNVYVQRIWYLVHWKPPHAHNGILELWLELGVFGTALFLIVFFYYSGCAIRFLRRHAEPFAVWPLIFLIFLFLANLTESFFISANSIYFLLFVAAAFMCQNNSLGELPGAPRATTPTYA